MINIKVNNTTYQFQSTVTLDQIINQLDISVNGIAVAINQSIITKSDWISTTPNDGDALLIIKATQADNSHFQTLQYNKRPKIINP